MKTWITALFFACALMAVGESTAPASPGNAAAPPTSPADTLLAVGESPALTLPANAAPAPTSFADALKALLDAKKGVIYSLEPTEEPKAGDPTFHTYKVLGHAELNPQQMATAMNVFVVALARSGGATNVGVLCRIQPRHALSIVAGGHIYDYLLCFQCGQLEVFVDNTDIGIVTAGRSPEVLNNLLTSLKIPLSQSGLAEAASQAATQKKDDEQRTRWAAAMPKSLQPFWGPTSWQLPKVDVTPMRAPLASEFPDATQRIRTLLSWYGSGAGPWSGSPLYEQAPEILLRDYSTGEIVGAMQSAPLTDAQM